MTSRTARAELDLRWDAPPGCPERDEVLERIRALVGPTLDKTAGLSAEGRIAHVKGRYYLSLLVRDGSEVKDRVIASDACADLAGAAAVTLVLLLGMDLGSGERSEAVGERPSSLPEERPSGRAPAATEGPGAGGRPGTGRDPRNTQRPEPERRPPVPSTPAPPRPWAILLRAPIGVVDSGPLPRPTVGLGLGAGVRYEAWRVLFTGYVSRGQTVSAQELGATYSAELNRLTGQLTLCRGWRSRWFEIAPCVGLAFEHLTARGFGENVSGRSRRTAWPAPGAGIAAHWYSLKSLALFADVSGHVELSRPHVVIDGVGKVAELAPAAVGTVVGVEWIF